jgi:hypothetical protein
MVLGTRLKTEQQNDTRHAAVQRNSGIGAAETEESLTLRRSRKRKR